MPVLMTKIINNLEISTPKSRAREILLNHGYNTCSNIWAAEVVLFEMWCGEVIFSKESRAVRLAIMEHMPVPTPVAYIWNFFFFFQIFQGYIWGNQYYPNRLLETESSDQEYILYKFKTLDKYVGREDGDPDEQFINLIRCYEIDGSITRGCRLTNFFITHSLAECRMFMVKDASKK